MPREPGYRLHKPTGQAYVYLSGRMFYLGKHGTPESREKYERLKAEWLRNRHSGKFVPASTVTMAQVCLAYLDHAEEYYAQGSEYEQLRLTVKPVSELYSMHLACEFGPLEFKTVRGWWLDREVKTGKDPEGKDKPPRRCTRQYCNKQMKRLLRVIKWAVSSGMMPADKYTAIKCIEPLKAGRCAAPEAEPVKCVPQELVDATLPHLTTVLADMVRFQQLTGCRPGELCSIKPGMVDRSGDVWTIPVHMEPNMKGLDLNQLGKQVSPTSKYCRQNVGQRPIRTGSAEKLAVGLHRPDPTVLALAQLVQYLKPAMPAH